jgi:hypothetical protein
MEVQNQEGQGPLWAVVPLMMMMMKISYDSPCKQDCSLNGINQLILVMVECYVFFEVWTEFFHIS